MRKMPPPFLDRYSHILKSVKKKQKEYDEFDISGFAGCWLRREHEHFTNIKHFLIHSDNDSIYGTLYNVI